MPKTSIKSTKPGNVTLTHADGSTRLFWLAPNGEIKEALPGIRGGSSVCKGLARTGAVLTAVDTETMLAVIRKEHRQSK